MTTKSYKCTLLSDVIMNQSLATAGNVATLDYIPGSVFMGIIARQTYKDHYSDAYDILHGNKVKFGDATISNNGQNAYHFPMSLYRPKLKKYQNTYLHHLLNDDNYPKDDNNKLQLKQVRNGFFIPDEHIELSVQKRFTIKSARDKATRKSKDAQMFGYESIRKGQVFTFSIAYDDDTHIPIVEQALLGEKRVGKSRTAEYSLAKIESLESSIQHTFCETSDYTLIYAHSNLCFLDQNGHPTLKPSEQQLGVEGNIDWTKSQIRTYEYTSWNGKRNTPNAQRFCIARGSVFYVTGKNTGRESYVGEYLTEGLGHVLINPQFLFEANEETAQWNITTNEEKLKNNKNASEKIPINSTLGRVLFKKQQEKGAELKLSKEIKEALDKYENKFDKITRSQWGNIRTYATNSKDDNLKDLLFKEKIGYLSHGVAFDRYWNKNGNLERLKIIVDNNSSLFVAKFAAEMAKKSKS